jgi:hypothetical protein
MLPVRSLAERSTTAAGGQACCDLSTVTIRSTWNFGRSGRPNFELEQMLYPSLLLIA